MTDAALSAWIGRSEEVHDQLSRNLVMRIAATLGEETPAHGEALPPLWHWAFFQNPVAENGLGEDGHPARGGFLPPADNRNRMWAGGKIEFIQSLRVGGDATRVSTITHIEEKHGSTGALLFVTVQHEYFQDGELAIREDQNIVYREPSPPKNSSGQSLVEGDWQESITPTATLLFRYSAVTFNGHRIHYDWPYVTDTEGYSGLVVHGPLIATLSLRAFCRANPQARLRQFSYRGLRPLVAPHPFEVGGKIDAAGSAQLWAGNEGGMAQRSEVKFD
ncbi:MULTISPECIES: FAS1-like dehydratase domain-containing protein [Pseudomonas]|uniref:Itaconyl-CoA hydratase / mesaconyl-C4 CoA hydratase n=1 Tax=Pseudomonas segetis TaxID=298908 RepID=A0A239IUC1_9PSED|nr:MULTISPECIES: MaoC family dehydratase N-terminal domain-containing protein [Pseudomonas]SNS96633.1 itaconyl-CoA hydratase / mesaconyl-C4 CoA hydratase [Pseudomonas segetis]